MTFWKDLSDDFVLIFPTPLIKRAIPGAEAVNQRLSELILERASQEPGVQQTNRGGWQSKTDLLDWPYPEIDQLKH